MLLAQNVGFACLALRVQGIEALIETFFRRLAGVDRATHYLAVHRVFSAPLVPKKAGPDHCVPVIRFAIGDSFRKVSPR